ncbi:MAG: flavodoxin-dependent (E)-4-hydroxy-3-methylbut-2-enyl-diphosphate synthase [Candidatus Ornithospirochaeta sp.]|nr:flavodoxin-dependent (E)-4-hydroxy-3-methylbut-2-enyl-diphosphate synthase [Sphaerochaetaceae bacterium]MDD7161691.1 flavodoxin-dependent (E)-4-hydroxy-3-methylbut-2-enyl-diphosphate synthase [Sphaerochaetaceae bacterium]MDY5524111.1 flavodoxin-dependent (E)-4-hydroxy-3-methylbut-2-enyl-diphosphate synthase [Candidatus Ornithospirochaeta sp.]
MNSRLVANVGTLAIGGDNPVRVQTMYDDSIKDTDPQLVVDRINTLAAMGCDLIRFSYVSSQDGENFRYITSRSPIPVVADIHFDYRLALEAMDNGAAKIRINPGNIGDKWKTKMVVQKALDYGKAIRIGLNTGSLPRHDKSVDDVDLMVDTALEYISDFEAWGFRNTVVSLKSSDIEKTVKAARMFKERSDYPFHLGVTEAGNVITASVRSTWALGNLLKEGIGDTIRVSINGSIEDEVLCANEILRTLGLKKGGVRIVACPRCGRHTFDSQGFLSRIQNRLYTLDKDITVAVMGCSVNGPGEAHNADFAVTGNGRKIFLYVHGQLIETIEDEREAEEKLFSLLNG